MLKGHHRLRLVDPRPGDEAVNRTYPAVPGPHGVEGPCYPVAQERNREYWSLIAAIKKKIRRRK